MVCVVYRGQTGRPCVANVHLAGRRDGKLVNPRWFSDYTKGCKSCIIRDECYARVESICKLDDLWLPARICRFMDTLVEYSEIENLQVAGNG